jgi:hypothetical protein
MPEKLSRRKFLKISLVTLVGTPIMLAAGYAYARDIEPQWVEVVYRELRLRRLHPAFDGYRLAQISDIHMGTGMTAEHLLRVVEMVNQQQPDAVAITGDFITHGDMTAFSPGLIAGLSQLKARDGVFAVLGNHDHWTDRAGVRRVLRASGITELCNAVSTLQRGEAQLHLCGVDDYWERKSRLEDVLRALPEDGAAILLAHEPDFADISAATGRFDLQISGHSHGGQFILPILNRPVIVPRYGQKYPLGQYQVGSMIQYTNRGLGTILPAVRFNCRPEITVFTLRA